MSVLTEEIDQLSNEISGSAYAHIIQSGQKAINSIPQMIKDYTGKQK